MSADNHVTESRWNWLWYFLKWCAYAEPRPVTPREMELLDVISERDAEIARLGMRVDELLDEAADKANVHLEEMRTKNVEAGKLEDKIAALEYALTLTTEFQEMAMNDVKVRSAALAMMLPSKKIGE